VQSQSALASLAASQQWQTGVAAYMVVLSGAITAGQRQPGNGQRKRSGSAVKSGSLSG